MTTQKELDFFRVNESPTPVAFFKEFDHKSKKEAISRWCNALNTALAGNDDPKYVEISRQYKQGAYKRGIDAYFSSSSHSVLAREKVYETRFRC